jgi:hypothetical protein
MYSKRPSLIIGFHGCEQSTRDVIVNHGKEMKISSNDYDWLGERMYFWENNYERALKWAVDHGFQEPSVLGAFIDLGNCLDFLDERYLRLLPNAYQILKDFFHKLGEPIPMNTGGNQNGYPLRRLDCAVIQVIHRQHEQNGRNCFDTVRGVFFEGERPYTNSGFRMGNHIQISVRNPNSIKGYFIPRKINNEWCNP